MPSSRQPVARRRSLLSAKTRIAVPVLLLVVALDQFTKAQAELRLVPEHAPYPVVGDFIRFTLTHNTGAAMSISLGDWSRPIFSLVAVLALMLLYRLFIETAAEARWRAAAIALIAGGAIGNLIDRLTSDRGVTDFIDIGLPVWRFWTFNVADIGVTCGALLLAVLFWLDDAEPEPRLSPEGGNDGTL